jgi:hypothetical protein
MRGLASATSWRDCAVDLSGLKLVIDVASTSSVDMSMN